MFAIIQVAMEEFQPPAPPGMERHWREGLRQARSRFAQLNPLAAVARSGGPFEGGKFTIPLLRRVFQVSHPAGEVVEVGVASPPPLWLHILLLHYLLTADGTPIADIWITYRYLPGALLAEERFFNMATQGLVEAFGRDPQGLRRAAEALGGEPMSRTGDVAYRFLVLPRIPMGCLLYLGEEDIPPSISLLFDASAPHYLPTEDLSYLGAYLSRALVRQRGQARSG